jgi:hypothetical protein
MGRRLYRGDDWLSFAFFQRLLEVWKGRLTEFSAKLLDVTFGDRVFAVRDGLNFESEVGASANVSVK